jgi:hypothetical protein
MPDIPDPPNRKPSHSAADPRDPNMNALKGEAIGVGEPGPIEITRDENEKEARERATRGRYRRKF